MLDQLLDYIFGCRHKNTTRPISPLSRDLHMETYVTCLECGKQFHYDMLNMRLGDPVIPARRTPPVPVLDSHLARKVR